jgi:A/G-specific adenine glycosylase
MGRSSREAGDARRARVVEALGAWFDGAARDLPWRRTRDPWAILLSEVMLQQTRVDVVVPYWSRMLERFPTPADMAAAPIDDVLSRWSGLGYYRRARNLWLCAREVVERFGGALPPEPDALRTLPGVGAYTAGAVASIAFDRPAPLVDGNVARVLARLAGIDDDPRSGTGQRRLWSEAASLVPQERPGRFNQALMELGATICTPRSPACAVCPLEKDCVARRDGRVGELPKVAPKRAPREVHLLAAVLRDASGRAVLARRPADGSFGAMWEPPMMEAGTSAVAEVLRGAGLLARGARLTTRGEVRHVLSHRALVVTVASGRAAAPLSPASALPPYEAIALEDAAAERGLSTLARRVLAAAPGRA